MAFLLVGLDPSLAETGIACIRPETGDRLRHGIIPSASVPSADYMLTLDRIRRICARVIKWVDDHGEPGDTIVIAMEAPIYPSKKMLGLYHVRAGLWWMLCHLLAKKATMILIEPTKLKSYVTSDGGASKEAMLAQVNQNFPGERIENHNAADAVGLVCMIARELGFPQEPSVQRCNPGALDGVPWPEWITARREALQTSRR